MDTGGRERGADMRPDGKSPDRRDVLFEMNRVSTEYLYDINLFLHKGELVSVECRNHETAESFVSVLRGDAGKCRGELKLSGRTLSAGDTGRRVRDGIVTMDFTVPERYSFSAFTVLEQYMFPRRVKYRGLWRQSRYHAYLKKMIEERKGKGSAGVSMSELYPGDTMRLLLRAWVLARPGVFVCSGLYFGADPDLQEDITRILLEMAAKGTAVMILTQDGGRWAAVADRRYELTEYGTLERVYV